MYKVPTPNSRTTGTNDNGSEYWGDFKLCIPADDVPEEGEIKIRSNATVLQFLNYRLEKPALCYQDCVVGDPPTTDHMAESFFK